MSGDQATESATESQTATATTKRTKRKVKKAARPARIKRGPSSVLAVGGVVATDKIEFVNRGERASLYAPVFEKLAALKKEGQSFEVKASNGTPLRVLHNRLTAALKRFKGKPPAGHAFRKGATKRGSVAISLVKVGK